MKGMKQFGRIEPQNRKSTARDDFRLQHRWNGDNYLIDIHHGDCVWTVSLEGQSKLVQALGSLVYELLTAPFPGEELVKKKKRNRK